MPLIDGFFKRGFHGKSVCDSHTYTAWVSNNFRSRDARPVARGQWPVQAFDLLNRGARSARAGEVQPKVGDAVGEPQTTAVVGDEVTGGSSLALLSLVDAADQPGRGVGPYGGGSAAGVRLPHGPPRAGRPYCRPGTGGTGAPTRRARSGNAARWSRAATGGPSARQRRRRDRRRQCRTTAAGSVTTSAPSNVPSP